MKKIISFLAMTTLLLAGCDSETASLTTAPATTGWTLAPRLNSAQVDPILMAATSEVNLYIELQDGTTKEVYAPYSQGYLSIEVPSGESCNATVYGTNSRGGTLWSGKQTFYKSSPSTSAQSVTLKSADWSISTSISLGDLTQAQFDATDSIWIYAYKDSTLSFDSVGMLASEISSARRLVIPAAYDSCYLYAEGNSKSRLTLWTADSKIHRSTYTPSQDIVWYKYVELTPKLMQTPFAAVITDGAVGAQNAAAGSFIRLKSLPSVYTTSGLQSIQQTDIDLIFFSDSNGVPGYMSPKEALAQDLISASWTGNANDTKIAKVSSAPTTPYEAQLLSITESFAPAYLGNSIYVVKLVDGTFAVIQSKASGNGIDAAATITILK